MRDSDYAQVADQQKQKIERLETENEQLKNLLTSLAKLLEPAIEQLDEITKEVTQ